MNKPETLPQAEPEAVTNPTPNVYSDSKRLGQFSEWDAEMLEARTMQYGEYLQTPDLMPRARLGADRVLNHLLFELAWRDGIYEGEL
jgi:hypothetical protein